MKSLVLAFGLLAMTAAGAAGQSSDHDTEKTDSIHSQQQEQAPRVDEKHLSKREKKELKKQRKREEKERKAEAKREQLEAKRAKAEQDRDRRREAKENGKQLRDKLRREDKIRDEERRRESAEESREQHHQFEADRRRVARERGELQSDEARALRAQQRVSQSIYSSEFRNSNVRVLLNGSNQIVLRGSAPSPSFRQRLLRLATAAAGGYTIVDQLAADAVGSAASAATSGVIGGISNMVHGSGSSNNAPPPPYDNSAAPPSNAAPAYAGNNAPPPPAEGDQSAYNGAPALSNACATVYESQVALDGHVASEEQAQDFRSFALELGGAGADVVNHLVLDNGQPNNNVPMANNAAPPAPGSSIVRPGSVVCMRSDPQNEVVLTGHVGSAAELANVERAVQPLLGGARLVDQLSTEATSNSLSTGDANAAASSNIGNTAPLSSPTTARPDESNAAAVATANPSGAPNDSGTDLEQALHSIPRLSGVDAAIDNGGIRLTGNVDSGDADQLARSIAQQYSAGRPVTDNINVGGATVPK